MEPRVFEGRSENVLGGGRSRNRTLIVALLSWEAKFTGYAKNLNPRRERKDDREGKAARKGGKAKDPLDLAEPMGRESLTR